MSMIIIMLISLMIMIMMNWMMNMMMIIPGSQYRTGQARRGWRTSRRRTSRRSPPCSGSWCGSPGRDYHDKKSDVNGGDEGDDDLDVSHMTTMRSDGDEDDNDSMRTWRMKMKMFLMWVTSPRLRTESVKSPGLPLKRIIWQFIKKIIIIRY